ncbi:MAG: Npt1/Npt2 family nucleotide transporter [Pseudomonadota bacterium]
MRPKWTRWLSIQADEASLFLWTAGLYFLMASSNLVLDNFVETTFLRRYGVENLPLVYMANSFVAFFSMGALMGLMIKYPSGRLLRDMMICFAFLLAGLRVVVAMEVSFVYPLLFLLRSQVQVLNAMVFWNLANDLFNTRQSKRIFPLVSAAGMLGAILASLATPWLNAMISIDNFMLAYSVLALAAAVVVWRMSVLFPPLPLTERSTRRAKKEKSSMVQEIKNVWPLMKTSNLVKIMVVITFLPNVLIPIMNFLFNFTVSEAFSTEKGMLAFFGYFRASLSCISFVILMFVGKLYNRWGLPVALMFHPANYVFSFAALLMHFSLYSAMYARITTQVLRDTINNPAREVLMGLFPPKNRAVLKTFLRGTVVRIGIVLGSSATMLAQDLFHPRYLSLIGLVLGSAWMVTAIWLKRTYSRILLELISQDMVDLKSLERSDVDDLFQDKTAQGQLLQACVASEGAACVWFAELMKARNVADLDDHLLELLPEKAESTAVELVELIEPQAAAKALPVYMSLADPGRPNLTAALARSAARMHTDEAEGFLRGLLAGSYPPPVQAAAATGLYTRRPEEYQPVVEGWLASPEATLRAAGAEAAGQTGDERFIPLLRQAMAGEDDEQTAQQMLLALDRLGDPQVRAVILARLETEPGAVPVQVIRAYQITDEASTRAFLGLLGHPSEEMRDLALERLRHATELDVHVVLEALATPNRRLRQGVLHLMESLQISDPDLVAFAKAQMTKAYRGLLMAQACRKLPESSARELLIQHFQDQGAVRVDTVLRVLVTQDASGRMRLALRGVYSPDGRMRANALEAMESLLGHELARSMVPLLENIAPRDKLAQGQKFFDLGPEPAGQLELFLDLLDRRNWTTLCLSLEALASVEDLAPYREQLQALAYAANPRVCGLAAGVIDRWRAGERGEAMPKETTTSLSERIVLLRRMDIFAGLAVSELAAVAAVTEDQDFAAGQVILTEGEMGDAMYFVVSGAVSVSKMVEDECRMELGTNGPGEYFGEMALFDNLQRSATVVATQPTRLLMLHKREFSEVVREYPQVALQICTDLSRRVRELQAKLQGFHQCEIPPRPPEAPAA